ncbi:hypothetical protein FRC01_009402, partial [Tulasnella sp. 417]
HQEESILYDNSQGAILSASPQHTREEASTSDGSSNRRPGGAQGLFPHQEAQELTNRWDTPVLPAPTDELAGSSSTRRIENTQVLEDDSDGPPGLSSVSGSTDIGEESGDDPSGDDQMPDLQPIGFYNNRITSSTPSADHPTGGINPSPFRETTSRNPGLDEPTRSEGLRRPVHLGTQDTSVDVSMFPDRFAAFMSEVYRTINGLQAATTSNRAREIVEKMHVLDKEELKRFQTLVMLQADNEEDRVRGASCSVCWEVLIPADEQKDNSLQDGKGKGKERDSRSSVESDGSGSSAQVEDKKTITLAERTDEDIGRGSHQRSLDLPSRGQEGNSSPGPRFVASNSIIDAASRPPTGNNARSHHEALQGLPHASERLSGIRDTLNDVQSRIRRVENRLEDVEGRLRDIPGRFGTRSNALDSPRTLGSRQDVGLFDVGSREEAIRRLRSLAAGDSSTSRSLPGSVNLPVVTAQPREGEPVLDEGPAQLRNRSNPITLSPIIQSLVPTSFSSTTYEPIVDPLVTERHPEPAPTTTVPTAPIEQSDGVGPSILGDRDPRIDQGSSAPSTGSAVGGEDEDEDTVRLEQEIRELEEQLESDRLHVQIGDNALQQLSGIVNNLSRVLQEAALQEQVFSQAIDALQVHSQGQSTGSPGPGTTSSDTQTDSRALEQSGSSTAVPGPSDGLGPRASLRGPDPQGYVPPPGRLTFEEMLISKEKEQGLRCPGICGKLLEEGGCSCPTGEQSVRGEKSG